MFRRLCQPSGSESFFLFGARGTGKSTLIRTLRFLKNAVEIDLLKPSQEEAYALRPELLAEQAAALKPGSWIVIDEVQKVPKLLDVVHSIIENHGIRFALTGSSSRKLKRGGANLLAGRAFVFSLFPLTSVELGDRFDLRAALQWGALPKIFQFSRVQDRARFLRTYVQTYVKEEIVVEQLIRNLDPFRMFLPAAAQAGGEIINYSNIARDTGVDHKTVQQYYQILVDTHLGFFLEPHHRSFRKVQIQSPKFYFFDLGLQRALHGRLNIPLEDRGQEFGRAFEAWFINECVRLNSYGEKDFRFSYLRTKDGTEVDLILTRPDDSQVWMEIKSSETINPQHVKTLAAFRKDVLNAEMICVSRVSHEQKISGVWVLPWKKALMVSGFPA